MQNINIEVDISSIYHVLQKEWYRAVKELRIR